MLKRYYIVIILLALKGSYASYGSDLLNDNYEGEVHEGSPCEIKIAAALSVLKTEMNRKLDATDSKIPANLEEIIISTFNALEKAIPEQLNKVLEIKLSTLENNNNAIHEKLHKLEKNILDKLEEYVDGKFNSLEKQINRKMDALEKNIPDKTDTNIMNHKLDSMKKLQLDIHENVICKSTTLANKTSGNISEEINNKLNVIEINISSLNNFTNFSYNALDKNLTDLEENLSHKLIELRQMVLSSTTYDQSIYGIEESIKNKLDALDKKVTKYFEENINVKLDATDKKILISRNNVSESGTKFEQNLDHKLDEMQKKIPELEQNLNKRLDVLQNLENNVLTQINETRHHLGCKEKVVKSNFYAAPYVRMDSKTLNHVIRKHSTNDTFFEMHFALKGDAHAYIVLVPESNSDLDDKVGIEIGIFKEEIKVYQARNTVIRHHIPSLLSATRFTPLYITIANDTMKMGKEGSSSPLISYSDASLKTLNYFSFGTSKIGEAATFLYDCPGNIFQLLFQEY